MRAIIKHSLLTGEQKQSDQQGADSSRYLIPYRTYLVYDNLILAYRERACLAASPVQPMRAVVRCLRASVSLVPCSRASFLLTLIWSYISSRYDSPSNNFSHNSIKKSLLSSSCLLRWPQIALCRCTLCLLCPLPVFVKMVSLL